MTKALVVLFSLFLMVGIPMFIKNVRQYFLGLAAFMYVFSEGWIFYHYNGIWYGDLPIIGLILLTTMTGRRFRWTASPTGWPLLGIVILGTITAFSATNPGWAISEMTKYGRTYLLILCIVHHVQSYKDLKKVVYFLLGALLIEAVVGLHQWRFGPVGLWFLGERAASRISWRSMGTFFVPSFYANYLALVLPVAFRMFIYYRPANVKHTYYFGACFVFGTMALFTTYGRGPWLGFMGSIGVLFLVSLLQSKFKPKIKWTMGVAIIFALAFTARYGPKVLEQFGEQRQSSYDVRFPQFQIAGRIISDNAATGVGLGNYELVSWNYMTPEELAHHMAPVYGQLVHNSYYLFCAEMGLLGGVLLALWMITMLMTAISILRMKIYNSFIVNLTLGILGGVLSIAVVFTFSPDIHAYQLLYHLGIYSALLISIRKLLKTAEMKKRREALVKRREALNGNMESSSSTGQKAIGDSRLENGISGYEGSRI